MSYSCRSCGATVGDNVNYCPNCGAVLVVNGNANYTGGYDNSNTYGNNNYTSANNSSGSDMLKTAAVAGGTALGVTALASLVRNMTHRRRTPYMGGMIGGMMGGRPPMGPPPGGMGGMGGPHGGMGGPGGMR